MERLLVLDTTLRDGAQCEGIHFSVEDKLHIAARLDALRVDYIEGGNPAASPTDAAFFARAQTELALTHARLAAFGATCRAHAHAQDDEGLRALAACGARAVSLFGKSWDFHVTDVLRCDLAENVRMISDSVRYLAAQGIEVLFDAEHFFDGYAHNPAYALDTLRAAVSAGASAITLCDTNGGALPWLVEEGVRAALALGVRVGIHCHNDAELAVANTLCAVRAGASLVQGTVNGIGERCGNANLCAALPALCLKMALPCAAAQSLPMLTSAARYIAEIANMDVPARAAYVGGSAFAHKGGMHVDGVLKNTRTFEHVAPEAVGNGRRLLLSGQAGRAALLAKLQTVAPELTRGDEAIPRLTAQIKQREREGYSYEAAEGSFRLLVLRLLGRDRTFFEVKDFRVSCERPWAQHSAQAIIKVVVDGREELTAAEGDGPVNALDKALRKALTVFYPQLSRMWLRDFKVRVINTAGTASIVRVHIESTDGRQTWGTVGVSSNIIEACWRALEDSICYMLLFCGEA